MAYEVLVKKAKRPDHFAATFPQEASLDAGIVRQYKMDAALRRFGRALAKQFSGHRTHSMNKPTPIIGVSISSVSFQFVLGEKPEA